MHLRMSAYTAILGDSRSPDIPVYMMSPCNGLRPSNDGAPVWLAAVIGWALRPAARAAFCWQISWS